MIVSRLLLRLLLNTLILLLSLTLLIVAAMNITLYLPPAPQLVYQSNRAVQWDIYAIDVQRGIEARLSNDSGFDGSAEWSPNGDQIVFTSTQLGHSDIFVFDLQTRLIYPVTNDRPADVEPSWVADGSLRFDVESDTTSQRTLYDIQPNGQGQRRLYRHKIALMSSQVSPDGYHVTYVDHVDGHMEVFVADAWNEMRYSLSNATSAHDAYPVWSADGQWIAFASNRDGNWELYIARQDGSQLQRVTFSIGDDTAPNWRP
jgi:TolB protein